MTKKDLVKEPQGSSGQGFGLGLLIGGLAGVSAYFMFGTEQGNALKKKLVEEFEYAKVKIPRDISEILKEAENQNIAGKSEILMDSMQERMGLLAKLTGRSRQVSVNEHYPQEMSGVKKKPRNLFYKSGKKVA